MHLITDCLQIMLMKLTCDVWKLCNALFVYGSAVAAAAAAKCGA